MNNTAKLAFIGTALLSNAFLGTAIAQETAASQAPEQPLQEVIVTAQFRSERLQETPIAISAFSGADLEQKNVTDITGAASFAPNVNLTPNPAGFGQIASIFIRGVGQADPHFAVEPGVGMYIDDVYYGVLPGSVFQLLDTDRVEISRGPQGTLAGKDSLGGSIRLYSVQPGPDPNAYVEASTGSLKYVSGRAASNFTLVDDTLFARISVAGQRRDGYLDRLDYSCATGAVNGTTQRTTTSCLLGTEGGLDTMTARGSLLWKVNDHIRDTLIFDIDEDNSENPATKLIYAPQRSPFGTPTWATGSNYFTCSTCYSNYETNVVWAREPGSTPVTLPDTSPLSEWGATNNFKYDFADSLSLTSITGYRRSRVHFYNPVDASPASVEDQSWQLDHRQITEELRLSGAIGHLLDWTIGGYYYDASGISQGRIFLAFGLAPGGGTGGILAPDDILFHDPVKTRSSSGFAHLEIHPIEKMTLTLGGRYTSDSKDFTFYRYDPLTGLPNPAFLYNVSVKYHGDRPDYRVNLDYDWTDNLMTYAQVSTGFRGGGVNPRPFFPSQALPYNAETITAYEVGGKSQFFDRILTVNAAAFFNQYNNFQATLSSCNNVSPFAGAPCALVTNVGDAHVKGAELEATLRPVGGLSFDASLGYLNFKYTSIEAATGITLGMTNPYSPKFTAAAGVQYEFQLGGAGSITPRLDYTFRSSQQTAAVNVPLTQLPSLGLFNARIAWQSNTRTWEAALAANNLADRFYYQSLQILTSPVQLVGSGTPGLPREFTFTIKRTL